MKKKNIFIILILITVILLLFLFKFNGENLYDDIKGNVYKNNYFGYSFKYEDGFDIDLSMEKIKTVFTSHDMEIEIFYDDFNNTFNNSRTYVNYGNKYIRDNDYIDVKVNKTLNKLLYKINVLSWERKKIDYIDNDKNNYVFLQYIKNKNEVYTVMAKSTDPIEYEDMVKRFKIGKEKSGSIDDLNFDVIKPVHIPDNNTPAGKYYEETFTDETPMKWGIFHPESCEGKIDVLEKLEEKLNYKFDILLDYKGVNAFQNTKLFQLEDKAVEYTLQVLGDNTDPVIMYEILEGKYDEVLELYAEDIKKSPNTVLVRLNNEMNGDWCSYSAWYTQTDTKIYKEVWKYIYEIFEKNEVENVLWIWNPNWGDFPSFKWNHYLNYFPGEEYVDVIGVTGYNTGTYYEHEIWRTFEEIYDPMMKEYRDYFDYRFMITEFGCSSFGGDKPAWISDMMKKIEKYNLDIAIWFSGIDRDSNGNPARIYKLDETKESIKAFKDGLKH